MSFGETMRTIRTSAGITLSEIAKQIGVSSVYLSQIELGAKQPPTSERICQIADVLRVPHAELLSAALVERHLASLPMPAHVFGQQVVALLHLHTDEAALRRELTALINGAV